MRTVRAVLMFACLMLGLAVAGLSMSYLGNRALVADTGGKVEGVAETHGPVLSGRGDAMAILAALDALRNLPGGYAERDESVPLHLGLGVAGHNARP